MRVLLLGGTSDARRLADLLVSKKVKDGIEVIYSLAGLVRIPIMECEVLVGGFSQFGGLTAYLKQQKQVNKNIDLILNATHPYAKRMSEQAVHSAKEAKILCWRFNRAAWQPQTGDNWHSYQNNDDLLSLLQNNFAQKKTLFLTAGQISEPILARFCQLPFEKIILRTAVKPSYGLDHLSKVNWKKAIGPFDQATEKQFIQANKVDLIVSKNSGGEATSAKLAVARELNIPVLMLQRPEILSADREFSKLEDCIAAVESLL